MNARDRTALEEIYECPLRGEVIDHHRFAEHSCCGVNETAEIYDCRLYAACSIVPVPDGEENLPTCTSCFEIGFEVGDLDHQGKEIK